MAAMPVTGPAANSNANGNGGTGGTGGVGGVGEGGAARSFSGIALINSTLTANQATAGRGGNGGAGGNGGTGRNGGTTHDGSGGNGRQWRQRGRGIRRRVAIPDRFRNEQPVHGL